jgi:hypothetical protein
MNRQWFINRQNMKVQKYTQEGENKAGSERNSSRRLRRHEISDHPYLARKDAYPGFEGRSRVLTLTLDSC